MTLNVALLVLSASPQHALSASASLSNVDSAGALSYRLQLEGWQVGAEALVTASREAFVAGYPVQGGVAASGVVHGVAPLVTSGPLTLSLAVQLGARRLFGAESVGPSTRSVVLLTRFGPIASVRLSNWVAVRAGWHNVINLELAPTTDVEALGQLLSLGAVVHLGPAVSAFLDVETGGSFGFSGDGGKYGIRGVLGVRWVLGEGARWNTF